MCDTFRPMYPTKAALDIDDAAYPESWRHDHFAPGEVRAAASQENGTVKSPVGQVKAANTWD